MDIYNNKKIIVSVSGGKDSTAVCLNLFDAGYTKDDFTRVFMDTGWEHQSTYEYLNYLESHIGKIIRLKQHIDIKPEYKKHIDYFEKKLGFVSPMIRRIFKYQFFPTRRMRYCTTEFKIKPIKKYFDTLEEDYINLVGIRHEESIRRSKMVEYEYNDYFDCWVHRPIIKWKEKEVIDIHNKYNVLPNRLYLNGSNRVGCYPCINSRKQEIKLLDPDRIEIIKELEQVITTLREERTGEKKDITFFSSKFKHKKSMNITDVMQWSRTARGGKQYELFNFDEPTCLKWGLCEHK